MNAMPPGGDVEMLEYVNGGEHAHGPYSIYNPPSTQYLDDLGGDVQPSESSIQKQGDWDDRQLIPDRAINW